jgi:hypothetical protein
LKQIRIFTNSNSFSLVKDVNNFIKNNNVKLDDIQYSTSGGSLAGIEYSVMIVFVAEEDK